MYINSFGHYLPKDRVPNEYFYHVNGLSDGWIYERTGIKTRTRASLNENTNTMAVEAVSNAADFIPYDIKDIDLIIGATYSPFDTVATLAHYVQRKFSIERARVVSVSSACSSFINAVEIVEGYFAAGKAKKAVIVASEHNSAYSNEKDTNSGHLWGDGAACVFISKDRLSENDWKIIDVYSQGLGHIGHSIEAVFLHPANGGLLMPDGKDVFIYACNYMIKALDIICEKNNISAKDLDYIIPHQANIRIINNIKKNLGIDESKLFNNIEELGNTGCASTVIALSQNRQKVKPGNIIGFTVFGGGYSCGSMIIQKLGLF